MEEFTEEYSSLLATKEWLVKVDNANSTPYLFKFAVDDKKNTCIILVTDMRTVWTEVLTRNQMFRRWRLSNPSLPLTNNDDSFSRLQSLIRNMHTPGGISDTNFDIVESRDADLAFELDCERFKWRWDTYLLGPKTSADVLSKHLILPLIGLAHVSFYSADPVSELEEGDLEKTVDKIGRTARRSIDIHVKQTLARPRIATTLQRITALLGLTPILPSIKSDVETPDLDGDLFALRAHTSTSDNASRPSSAVTRDIEQRGEVSQTTLPYPPEQGMPSAEVKTTQPTSEAESATESDDDGDQDAIPQAVNEAVPQASPSKTVDGSHVNRVSEAPISRHPSRAQDSDTSSPPTKRVKSKQTSVSDSESDSDSGTRGHSQGSRGASAGVRPVTGRGVRQPIKRGGKRF